MVLLCDPLSESWDNVLSVKISDYDLYLLLRGFEVDSLDDDTKDYSFNN